MLHFFLFLHSTFHPRTTLVLPPPVVSHIRGHIRSGPFSPLPTAVRYLIFIATLFSLVDSRSTRNAF